MIRRLSPNDPAAQGVRPGRFFPGFALVGGVALLLVQAMELAIVSRVGELFYFMIFLGALGLFVLSCLASLGYALAGIQKMTRARLAPVLISAAFALAAWFIPFHELLLDHNFRSQLAARERVVEMVRSGQLARPKASAAPVAAIRLPGHLAAASSNGLALVQGAGETLAVFFFTASGASDNFSGFLYRENGAPPAKTGFGGDLVFSKRYENNWFYAVFT